VVVAGVVLLVVAGVVLLVVTGVVLLVVTGVVLLVVAGVVLMLVAGVMLLVVAAELPQQLVVSHEEERSWRMYFLFIFSSDPSLPSSPLPCTCM